QQRAGVPKSKLRRLVLKELADNGLDSGANVRVGKVDGGYFVEDDGSGIDPDDVARLFSIARPMVSSKLWRLPTRGALGNGLVGIFLLGADDGHGRGKPCCRSVHAAQEQAARAGVE